MKRRRHKLVPILLVVALVSLAMLSFFSRKPANLGVVDGRLGDCPATADNCVCTQASDPDHRIEPLPFQGTPEEAMNRLSAIIATMPRAEIVTNSGGYMHVEFTSLMFRFVDDVEFLVDPAAKVIHFRSASRVGRSDLGVNRRRMEEIRRKFAGEPADQ